MAREIDNQETGSDTLESAVEAYSKLTPQQKQGDTGDEEFDDEGAEEDSSEEVEEEESSEGAEDEADEQAAEETPAETGQLYTVVIDGEQIQVPLEELALGYQRQADYTRKSMALADARRGIDAEIQQARTDRQQYAAGLQVISDFLQRSAPSPPPESLKDENSVEYAAQWAHYQQHQERQRTIAQQQQQLAQREQQEQTVRHQQVLVDETQKMLAAIPEWRNSPEKAIADRDSMAAFAYSLGFTEQDLKSITDHRAVLVLRKAWLYDQAQKQQSRLVKQVKEKAVRTVTAAPGAPAAAVNGTSGGYKRLADRARQTGREIDAVRAYGALRASRRH